VLDERLVQATGKQVPELLEWVKRLDGGDRIWAIESAGGLGYLLAQQLLAAGEHVVDIPATFASRVRLLGTGRSDKNDPNDARLVAIAALRAAELVPVRVEDTRWWRTWCRAGSANKSLSAKRDRFSPTTRR
jgi:transposase